MGSKNSKLIFNYLDDYWGGQGANNKSNNIKVVPLAFRKIVYGMNFYFRVEDYQRTLDAFECVQECTREVTHNFGWVNTLWSDYNHGYISVMFNVAHVEYSDDKIIKMIEKIVKELSSTAITAPPART